MLDPFPSQAVSPTPSLPPIGIGLWSVVQAGSLSKPEIFERVSCAYSLGFRLFDCSPAYASGRALQTLLELGRRAPDIQISLTARCVGRGAESPLSFLGQFSRASEKIRVVGLQPADHDAVQCLPLIAASVKRLLGDCSLAICNLPPHMAVLSAERIRDVFDGELFICLPTNRYTAQVNMQFHGAFRAVRARLLGYGLFLGGRGSTLQPSVYTYNQSVKDRCEGSPGGELRVSDAERLAQTALYQWGCESMFIGCRTMSQVATWANVLKRLTASRG